MSRAFDPLPSGHFGSAYDMQDAQSIIELRALDHGSCETRHQPAFWLWPDLSNGRFVGSSSRAAFVV
jgi:hypothetical protein